MLSLEWKHNTKIIKFKQYSRNKITANLPSNNWIYQIGQSFNTVFKNVHIEIIIKNESITITGNNITLCLSYDFQLTFV